MNVRTQVIQVRLGPTIYYLVKPQPREQAWQDQWGKKTLLMQTLT